MYLFNFQKNCILSHQIMLFALGLSVSQPIRLEDKTSFLHETENIDIFRVSRHGPIPIKFVKIV